MANVDGTWACTVATPIGDQDFTLTIRSAGDRFSATASGAIGSKDIPDGTVDGDTLGWTMGITKPMALSLTCRATVQGDTLEGQVKAGVLGSFPIRGTRA
jgi:hypothetical protein